MKYKIMTSMLVATMVQSSSAIELRAYPNRLEAGLSYVKEQVEYKDPGASGTECQWDFRQLKSLSNDYPVEYFVPDSSRMNVICGHEGRNRNYYKQENDSIWCIRYENSTFYIDYSCPELLLRFPFVYGDTLSSSFEGNGRYRNQASLFVKGSTRVSADASGVLKLPGETFEDILRTHTERQYTQINNDSVSIKSDIYAWYVSQIGRPIFESKIVTLQGAGADTTLSAVSYYYPPEYLIAQENLTEKDSTETEVLEIEQIFTEAEYLPNPVENDLTIRYRLTRASTIWFTLHSSGGVCVRQTTNHEEDEGLHTQIIPMSGLMQGVYTLYVHVDDLVLSVNIIKR